MKQRKESAPRSRRSSGVQHDERKWVPGRRPESWALQAERAGVALPQRSSRSQKWWPAKKSWRHRV